MYSYLQLTSNEVASSNPSRRMVSEHFDKCIYWKELVDFLQIDSDTSVDVKELQIQTVRDNTRILATSQRPLNLDFRESLEIKARSPELNKGLKSCKDLALF